MIDQEESNDRIAKSVICAGQSAPHAGAGIGLEAGRIHTRHGRFRADYYSLLARFLSDHSPTDRLPISRKIVTISGGCILNTYSQSLVSAPQ